MDKYIDLKLTKIKKTSVHEKVNEKNRHLKNLDKIENPTQRMGFFSFHPINSC